MKHGSRLSVPLGRWSIEAPFDLTRTHYIRRSDGERPVGLANTLCSVIDLTRTHFAHVSDGAGMGPVPVFW